MEYTPYEPIEFENGILVTAGKVNLETGEMTMPVYSGKAPINDTNLNHLEQGLINLEKYIKNNSYYKNGDTYQISNITAVSGWITGGSTVISFSLPVLKSLENINGITVDSFDIVARHIGGGYALNRQTTGTIRAYKTSENMITIEYTHDSTLSVTNNTPVAVALYSLRLTFN